jgi:hypothetical protein
MVLFQLLAGMAISPSCFLPVTVSKFRNATNLADEGENENLFRLHIIYCLECN